MLTFEKKSFYIFSVYGVPSEAFFVKTAKEVGADDGRNCGVKAKRKLT